MNEINSKQLLRQKCRTLRDSFGEALIEEQSRRACELLAKSPEFFEADVILLYYPIKNEISPLPLINLAKKLGKKIAMPVTNENFLSFHLISSTDELNKGAFGLFEPPISNVEPTITKKTLAIIPAIAFSRDGHRLGYGKGYYDRFLRNFEGVSAGISYSALIFDTLPSEAHDIPLKMLVSESEVLYFD